MSGCTCFEIRSDLSRRTSALPSLIAAQMIQNAEPICRANAVQIAQKLVVENSVQRLAQHVVVRMCVRLDCFVTRKEVRTAVRRLICIVMMLVSVSTSSVRSRNHSTILTRFDRLSRRIGMRNSSWLLLLR